MNKDVIYIEPEDDITDIITKIEKAKSKIVALVPPKKAGVFRSVVNIKLIAKAGVGAEKSVVLVTTDPSIVKLAAATKLPVAKNLQTAPVIPKNDVDIVEGEVVEETTEELEEPETSDEEDASDGKGEEAEEDEDDEQEDEPEKKPSRKDNVKAKGKKSANKIVGWIKDHPKIAIFGGIGCLVLIVGLIWACAIAPKATLTVGIHTTSNNFSETVSFTTKATEEDASEGKFYLEERKIETTAEVQFEATGQKNVGEKAHGDVVIYAYFKDKGTIQVSAGSTFTFNGLNYVSGETTTLSWDGATVSDCENNGEASAITSGCLVSGRVNVTAADAGSKYNVSASNSGWNTTAPVGAYTDKAMSGGTDETITVVQQSDIDKAKSELNASSESENKAKLYEEISDDALVIDSSFTQKTDEAVSSPKVGEEVKEGEKATLKATTTASVYTIDKTKVEEFITEKADLGDSQKIYEMKDPFIENFLKTDSNITGKLKTSYATGPKITENDVIEIVKGKGLGEAQHDLRDISGVSSVNIETSFPWVTSIPNDPNRITVIFEVKDQNGNTIEQKDDRQSQEEQSKEESKEE